ncbi:MAG: patatin-like phospholipase family protein [Gammaproteobacteria bacterium]|nr:patatin-like phospholipase family protein [Gammaproteobacteria bacterium]
MRGKQIGLALQGGGSYAAFTCGVLRRLLDGRTRFLTPEAIRSLSGTSGGALNAALLGKAIHDGCRSPLRYVNRLWQVNRLEKLLKSRHLGLKLVPDAYLSALIGLVRRGRENHPGLAAALGRFGDVRPDLWDAIDRMMRHADPGLVADLDDPLLPSSRPYVTVAATEVKSARAHYFTSNRRMIRKFESFGLAREGRFIRELTMRGVYASMAHPALFTPVGIGDEVYWDGYYTCNPPFVYLFREGCDEVLLVRLVQQRSEEVTTDAGYVRDRTEEIIQNAAVNMEILAYLAMRELMISNLDATGGAQWKLSLRKLQAGSTFHEIRLLKSGRIADEGYPLAEFVDTLIGLGQKVVSDPDGFVRTYRDAPRGRHVISEIAFESGKVVSRVIDLDKLLFEAASEEPPLVGPAAPG